MKLTKKQNIKLSIVITFITMVISMVIHFLYTPFMLNKVGDDQYGLYGFATSALSWLTVAINAILSAYNKIASEELVKDENNGEKKVNSIYSFMVITWAALITVISSAILVMMYFGVIKLDAFSISDQKTILILFGIVAIQMIISVATKVATLNITYNNHHVWVKLSTLIVTVAAPIISIPFLIIGKGIITVVTIQVVVNIISHILDIIYDRFVLKKTYRVFPKKADFKMLGPIFAFCSVILINEIAYQIDLSVDNLALGFKGYSSEISLYTLALSIVTIASTCSSMIYTPFIPTIFSNEANGKRDDNLRLYDLITFAQLSLWLFIAGGFISCGKEFVYLWVGEKREIVYYICSSLFIVRSIESCSGPTRDMMRASNKHIQRAILALCTTILNASLTIVFINVLPRESSIWGCLIGTAISSVIGWWITANIMNKHYLNIPVGNYFLTAFMIAIIAIASTAISFRLKTLFFSKILSRNYALFLSSGLTFVVTFLLLYLATYKSKIKEMFVLLRKK